MNKKKQCQPKPLNILKEDLQNKAICNLDFSFVENTYQNAHSKIKLYCSEHGEMIVSPNGFLSGSGKCINSLKNKKNNLKTFIQKSMEKHGDKYDYSKVNYINCKAYVIIICPIHGEFLQTPDSHLNGTKRKGSGCNKCNLDKLFQTNLNTILSTTEFIEKAKKIHFDKDYDYSYVNYIRSASKVEILCKKHGIFKQTANSHLAGHGCKFCTNRVSKGEKEWLDFIGIPNNSKYRNVRIPGINRRFLADGIDFKNKIVYEFNGSFSHGDPRKFNLKEFNPVFKATFGDLLEKTFEKKRIIESFGWKVFFMWEEDWKIIKKSIKQEKGKI